jgi:hypothetical protein
MSPFFSPLMVAIERHIKMFTTLYFRMAEAVSHRCQSGSQAVYLGCVTWLSEQAPEVFLFIQFGQA